MRNSIISSLSASVKLVVVLFLFLAPPCVSLASSVPTLSLSASCWTASCYTAASGTPFFLHLGLRSSSSCGLASPSPQYPAGLLGLQVWHSCSCPFSSLMACLTTDRCFHRSRIRLFTIFLLSSMIVFV